MSQYILHLLVLGGIYVILAASLNLTVGLSGQVSLGHGAFFGIGAYASALMSMQAPALPFSVLILFSGLTAMVAALVISPPALKLRDEYLAVVTLGLGIIFELWLKNCDFTGGPDGLYGLSNFGLSTPELAIRIWAVAALCLILTWRMSTGMFGTNLTAVKENEGTARAMGISPFPLKALCFAASALFAGMAGSLYAHYITFISPGAFGLHTSILLLCMVVLGGMGTVFGPVVGAVVLFLLPEFLQEFADFQDLVYGLLLVLTLIFRPQGILGRTGTTPGFSGRLLALLRIRRLPERGC
ncbi:MAG: branched-chain amino acid ABC transporter permease [Deltaproteobacteria bacterium]|nr:branched-chain amino acid ABC transporter permease [Deltaproteobacteria bacterium]